MPETETTAKIPPNASDKKKSSNTLALAIMIVALAVVCWWLWPFFLGLSLGLFGLILGILMGVVGLIVGLIATVFGLVVGLLSIFVVFLPFIVAGTLAVLIAMGIIKLLQK